jgi:hypothetical protein
VVIESDAFAHFTRCNPYHGIGPCVVVMGPLEDLNAQDSLLEAIEITLQTAAHDVGKKGGIPSAARKMAALQHSVELLKNGFVVDRGRGLADPALRLILHPANL